MVSDSNWDVYNVGRSCDTGSSVNTVGEFDLTTNDDIHDPYTTANIITFSLPTLQIPLYLKMIHNWKITVSQNITSLKPETQAPYIKHIIHLLTKMNPDRHLCQ